MNCKQVQRQLVSYINGELEEKEEELMVENHSISLDFRAFEIKTQRLKLAQRKEKQVFYNSVSLLYDRTIKEKEALL